MAEGSMVYIGQSFVFMVFIYSQCLIRSNKFSKYSYSGINSFLSYIGVAVILARTICSPTLHTNMEFDFN